MEFVVCVDTSDASYVAAEQAAEMAELVGATLTLVHSANAAVESTGSGLIKQSSDDAVDDATTVLDTHKAALEDTEVAVRTELLYGQPVEAIVDYLNESLPDAVYLGHRSLDSRAESMFGSFAKRLIGHSPVPVTVVQAESGTR
jgi:nucleotide-binding universal stress UspA family protein